MSHYPFLRPSIMSKTPYQTGFSNNHLVKIFRLSVQCKIQNTKSVQIGFQQPICKIEPDKKWISFLIKKPKTNPVSAVPDLLANNSFIFLSKNHSNKTNPNQNKNSSITLVLLSLYALSPTLFLMIHLAISSPKKNFNQNPNPSSLISTNSKHRHWWANSSPP